jgi:hypothetical protein
MALHIVDRFSVGKDNAKRVCELFALGKDMWMMLPKFRSPNPKPCSTKEELEQEQKQLGSALVHLAKEALIVRLGKGDERPHPVYYKEVSDHTIY